MLLVHHLSNGQKRITSDDIRNAAAGLGYPSPTITVPTCVQCHICGMRMHDKH